MKRKKHEKKLVKNKIQFMCIVTFIICSLYICYDFCYNYKEEQNNKEIAHIFCENKEEEHIEKEKRAEAVIRMEEVQKENPDIIGWIVISGTNINYPVMQSEDNSYYLVHNYKNEYSENGSIFLDKDFDNEKPSANYLIYGHRNRYGKMFDDLINYKDEEFYKEHPTIHFTTVKEDAIYEIMAVFLSRVYNNNETDVFRYYYFTDLNSKEDFDDYVNNSKEESLYEITKTAEYGDQLLTLSTCEYSQKDGRLAIVARKMDSQIHTGIVFTNL